MSALLPTLVPALGWALLDFLWQGAAIGLAAALLLAALRDGRPQARYLVACGALALCALLPLATLLAGLGGARQFVAQSLPAAPAAPLAAATALSSLEAGGGWHILAPALHPGATALAWIVAAWSLGASVFALRLLAGFAWVGDVRARARPAAAAWQQRMDALADAIGLAHPIALATAAQVDGPVVAGWWKPIVLVPASLLTQLPPDLVEALLAHELAHVRRHDYLVNLLQGAIEALLFYHPVVWWLSRRIRAERELIADDLALRAIGEPKRLARALQQLDLYQAARVAPSALHPSLPRLSPAAHGGKLMSRIQRLVVRPHAGTADWRVLIPLAGVALVALAAYAKAPPAAAAASPAASVAPAPQAWRQLADERRRHAPYALVREGEDGIMLSGDLDDVADVKQTRQHLHGDFLWFRRGDTAYVVQDPAVLARAHAAWGPAEALGQQMEAIGAQMKPYGDKMEALGARMEVLSKQSEPFRRDMEKASRDIEPISARQGALGEKMGALGARMASARGELEREKLQAEMEALQAQMEPLSEKVEQVNAVMRRHQADMDRWQGPMAKLGEEMRVAGEPMKPLAEKMRALGDRQAGLTLKADAEVQALIEQSLREGKALPARGIR